MTRFADFSTTQFNIRANYVLNVRCAFIGAWFQYGGGCYSKGRFACETILISVLRLYRPNKYKTDGTGKQGKQGKQHY